MGDHLGTPGAVGGIPILFFFSTQTILSIIFLVVDIPSGISIIHNPLRLNYTYRDYLPCELSTGNVIL